MNAVRLFFVTLYASNALGIAALLVLFASDGEPQSQKLFLAFFVLCGILVLMFITAATVNVLHGISLYKKKDFSTLRLYTKIFKFGLIPFWVINFCVVFVWCFILVAATRGIGIVVVPIPITLSYIVFLASSFYTFCLVALTQKTRKFKTHQLFFFIVLLLCYALDIIAAVLLLKKTDDPDLLDGMDSENAVSLKYPVLFVHGAGFRDSIFGIQYWGRIPEYLRRRGISVYFGGTDAWGSVIGNAALLKKRITEILAASGAAKLNIIAHSRGGLETRYVISALSMENSIASVTTISTPHHGVKIMNIALLFPAWLYKAVSFFVNLWHRILGDRSPDFYASSRALSEKQCAQFNVDYPDSKNVYYQSYAAKLKHFFGDVSFMLLCLLIKISDGENDGLCPVESAKWADYKGEVSPKGVLGISHAGIIDVYRCAYNGIDILEFYLNIAKDLAEKGF